MSFSSSMTSSHGICDICLQSSGAPGPWMQKSGINVHYFCLLLSTNLPQKGEDCSGICGFLLRDIRAEVSAAKKRTCEFCGTTGASISCRKCNIYFHLKCGYRNACRFEYTGEFNSYCSECYNIDAFEIKAKRQWNNPDSKQNGGNQLCHICKTVLGSIYSPVDYMYANCCNNGFVHRSCLQEYAMYAGYYLRCIWCGDMSFREKIRFKGIFVPDREAAWETKQAFKDLHRGHKRCDMEICKNSQGREHSSRKWKLINCILCGSFGAHYPICLTKNASETEFKCDTCVKTEKKLSQTLNETLNNSNDIIDTSIYIMKRNRNENMNLNAQETILFTDDENTPNKKINIGDIEEKVCDDVTISSTTPKFMKNNKYSNDTPAKDLTADKFGDFYLKPFETNFDPNLIKDLTKNLNLKLMNNTENIADDKFLEAYEFTPDHRIIGTCKFRLNMNDPRFSGKGIEEIFNTRGLLLETDVIERNGDIGIFKEINDFLESLFHSCLEKNFFY